MPVRLISLLTAPLMGFLSACAPPPSAIGPTLQAQTFATARMAGACAQDHALLRAQTASLLAIHRTVVTGELHRSLLRRGYLTPTGEPDVAVLDSDLAAPGAASPLVREIRAGAFTRDRAAAWLSDYSLALRMTDAGPTRHALLAQLSPMREFEAAAEWLLGALDQRTLDLNRLFADLGASSQALAAYSAFAPSPDASETLRSSLSALITSHITDPERRAAALELLTALLAPAWESNPVALSTTE